MLDELYVLPEYRGQGIGRELFKRLESEINALYDRLAQALKTENARLRDEIARLKAENEKLKGQEN